MRSTPPPSNYPSASPKPPAAPELLAPAGDRPAAEAAVSAGADAVYFGLATKTHFNARARAKNIPPNELDDLVAWLHRHGAKAYVTFNTLVFPAELPEAESMLRRIAASGADAVLVQDLGIARLARAVCASLPIHASTQMSLTSAEGIAAVESLGIERVILARELSIDDIRTIARQTRLTLEVFVHGALCISYSGQCLASRTLGDRSANRGDCAQLCRLPYQLFCDGEPVDRVAPGGRESVGNAFCGVPGITYESRTVVRGSPQKAIPTELERASPKYLLSPQDLAAYSLVPQLIQAGVGALKIEGRLKSADYVATVTQHYRRAIDAAVAGKEPDFSAEEIQRLEAVFSRGFSHGWLEGDRIKRLVTGRGSAKRGLLLGRVTRVAGNRVEVELAMPVRRGDGIAFEIGDDGTARDETGPLAALRQGGRVYGVYVDGRPATGAVAGGRVELAFARDAFALEAIRPGQIVRKTDDPEVQRSLKKTRRGADSGRRKALDLVVEAAVGLPLAVRGRTECGASCNVQSDEALKEAVKHPVDEAMLGEQLGRLGGTAYLLRGLEVRIAGQPMVPLSVLGKLRREIVAQLDASSAQPPRSLAAEGQLARLRAKHAEMDRRISPLPGSAVLHVLCRSPRQLASALGAGIRDVVVEYRDIAGYEEAIRTARRHGASILLATPRVQRPGETWVFEAIARHQPDGVLARNLAALDFFNGRGLPAVADFSLNAANDLTVEWLCGHGACRVTPSFDLSRSQLLDLVAATRPERLEVAIDLHVPMFHSQHCLFCAHLSAGTRRADCGRPCERHEVRLEDRKDQQHLVLCDALCRNSVFHAMPQSCAEVVPQLLAEGVRHYRIELLDDLPGDDAERLLQIYGELLAGRLPAPDAWTRLHAIRGGRITRGTLR